MELEVSVISRNRLFLLLCMLFWTTGCNFENEYHSPIPEREQEIIRRVLNANGYNLSDKELVDSYVGKDTDYHSGYWYGYYSLMIPNVGCEKLVLTEDLNAIRRMYFNGRIFPQGATVDSLAIVTDSIIFISRYLRCSNKLRIIPSNINKLRTRFLDIRDNQLTTLPEEIMELTSPPFPYDTFGINISGNPIDTTTLSDTLKGWLKRYSTLATGIPEKPFGVGWGSGQ